MKHMNKLVLLRHGQSQWNLENRFTGWKDVPLTQKGISEAEKAGILIKKNNIKIDKGQINLANRNVVGKDVKVLFNKSIFGNKKNDPRIKWHSC